MQLTLVQSGFPFNFVPSLLGKKYPLELSAGLLYQQDDLLGKRLKSIQDAFPNKKWTLMAELQLYDPESPKLKIKLEGELLKLLHETLYYGSNNERLQLNFTADVKYDYRNISRNDNDLDRRDMDRGERFRERRQCTITAKDLEVDDSDEYIEEHFRYVQNNVALPLMWLAGEIYYSKMSNVSWRISVELIVNDLVDLTGLLPTVSKKYAKMLEDKLFCDFAIISSDGASVPCHKSVLCVSSEMFMAKCYSKLNEPSKNQMTMDLSEQSVNALLEFIYGGDVQKPMEDSSIALDLFKAGHQYGLLDLETVIAAIFLQKSYEWYDIEVALELFQFLVNYEEESSMKLKEKIINVVAMKSDELQDCELLGEMFKTPVERQMFSLMAAAVKMKIDGK